jgi:ABC-type transport system substrate-binding protein
MIGAKLGDRYEISREIGRGGMGVVYLAHDELLDRDVALKLISATNLNQDVRQRFLREARVIAKLDHPSVLPVFDLGEHEDSLYFVMPFVEGSTLRKHLLDGNTSLKDAVEVGAQIAAALAHGHDHGVVHRDVKPENVLVDRTPSGLRVRLGDFGVALANAEERLTKTGALVGTPTYMSPEQISGGALDGRSDLYALGVILYECLAGQPPFLGPVQSVLFRIAHEPAQRLHDLGVRIEPELEAVIMACLAKEPALRPQSAREVQHALERFLTSIADDARSMALLSTLHASRPKSALAPPSTRLVGRDRELAALCRGLEVAIGGSCHLALVGGEPGTGKRRLIDELERLALARGVAVFHGELAEGGQSYPYRGFAELIEECCRGVTSTGRGEPDFSDLVGDLVGLFPALEDVPLIRRTLTRSGLDAVPPALDRTRIFELLARALGRIASIGPVVLVFSRLHEADVSLDALAYVARRLSNHPILFLGSFVANEVGRSHPLTRLLESFRGSRRMLRVDLADLGATEHAQLVEALLHGRASEGLRARLFELTQGSPYFTVELVRSLLDAGSIVRTEDGSFTDLGPDTISPDVLPDTIHKAVEARLSRISDDERTMLEMASVLGVAFEYRELEELTENPDALDTAVDALVRGGFLAEERRGRVDRLAFGSALLHGVVYRNLPRRTCRRLHSRAADALERVHRGRPKSVLAQLLHHRMEADDAEAARELGLELGRSALSAFAAEDAISAARKVLAFADDDAPEAKLAEGEAHAILALAHRMKGELEAALRELDAGSRAFASAQAPGRVLDLLVDGAKTAYEARRLADTERWLERALPLLRAADDPRAVELLVIAATMANLRGDVERARDHAEEVDLLRRDAPRESAPQGGTLRIAYANRTQSRYIAGNAYVAWAEREFTSSVFETLVGIDGGGNPSPRLAESWETNAEHTSFTFQLRQGIHFHDGRALTARDVVDSFERTIRETTGSLPQALVRVQGAEDYRAEKSARVHGLAIEGERRFRITLDSPLPSYPVLLTDIKVAVRGPATPRANGTGPFAAGENPHELVRNAFHWVGAPRLERIETLTFESPDDVVDAFRNGRIDLAMDLPVEHIDLLLADRRLGVRFVELNRRETRFLLFNGHRPFGKSEAARRAFFQSMPVDALVWRHVGPSAQPGVTLIPPGLAGHDPNRRRQRLTLDEARALIPADVPKSLVIATSPILYQRFPQLVEAVCEHGRELGLDVELRRATPEELARMARDPHDIDVILVGWRADYSDAANFTHDLFHSERGVFAAYRDAELDVLLEESLYEPDHERRVAACRSADHALCERSVVLPLLVGIDACVARTEVHGLEPRVLPPFLSYERASIRRERATRARWGWISVPMSERIAVLDPAITSTMQPWEIVRCACEGLTRETRGAEVAPWLAESIKSEDGGRRYRVKLRDDLRFHDGRKVTAWHVARAWERALTRGGSRSSTVLRFLAGADAVAHGEAREIAGMRVDSPLDFTLSLARQIPQFPAMLADSSAVVLAETLEGALPRGVDWVGTGPFRVKSFEPGERVELEANPYYWRETHPKTDGVTFSLGVSPEEALRRFRADQVTLLFDPPSGDENADDAILLEVPALATTCLLFNGRSGPFQHVTHRRAVIRALDVEKLALEHLKGRALPALGYLPPGVLGHVPRALAREPSTDSARFDTPVKLGLWSGVRMFPEYCAALVEQLGRAGLALEVVHLNAGEWVEGVDMVVGGWVADYPDADSMVRVALHTTAGAFGPFVGNVEIDALAEQAGSEREPEIRRDLYQRIEDLIVEHSLFLPLFHDTRRWLARPSVRGMRADQTGLARGIDLADLWLERRTEPRD